MLFYREPDYHKRAFVCRVLPIRIGSHYIYNILSGVQQLLLLAAVRVLRASIPDAVAL